MFHHALLPIGGLAALALLIACDQTSSVSATANASETRPWKESYQASGTIVPGARCPAPLLLVSLQGGGTATHIGQYIIVNSHCVDPRDGSLTEGTFVKTAVTGDQIFGSYVGSSFPIGPGTFSVGGTITFDRGTGQFADASGTARMGGSLEADFSGTPPWSTKVTLTMIGEISY